MGLRVLHLHDRLSALGGADRHLLGVLDRLQGRAETMLAVGHDDHSLPEGERAWVGRWRRIKGLDRSGFSRKGGAAAVRRLSEAIEAFGPTVIHIHNVMDPELVRAAGEAARTVMTVQDHRFFCPGLGKVRPDGGLCDEVMGEECRACFRDAEYGARVLELTRRRLTALGGVDRVLVLSNYMAGELTAVGLEPERVEVLPPFVHGLAGGGGSEPGGYHLLAGRLVERKGVRVALEAAGLLRGGAGLTVAGDGPLAGEVAEAAARSGGRIRYVGWADRAGMTELLAGALSLWLPSLWAEPFGIAGLEALALGVPVAASEVGGVGDWLEDGVNGFLLEAGDEAGLAEAADRLAGEPGLARAMGAAGRVMAEERFSAEVLMDRLTDVYERLAGDDRQRGG